MAELPTPVKCVVLGVAVLAWGLGRSCVLESHRKITADYLHNKEFSELGIEVTTKIRQGNFIGATFSFTNPGEYLLSYGHKYKMMRVHDASFQVTIPPFQGTNRYNTNFPMTPTPFLDLSHVYVQKLDGKGETYECDMLDGGLELHEAGAKSL